MRRLPPALIALAGVFLGAGCHYWGYRPGGQEASRPFLTYSQVYSERSAMLNQVYACNMPPSSAAKPTEEERQALLAWLVCGAPQN